MGPKINSQISSSVVNDKLRRNSTINIENGDPFSPANLTQDTDLLENPSKFHVLHRLIRKLIIEPQNKKLRMFKCLASFGFIVDVFFTGALNANYQFDIGL